MLKWYWAKNFAIQVHTVNKSFKIDAIYSVKNQGVLVLVAPMHVLNRFIMALLNTVLYKFEF